jgi:hypothetical protein
VPRKVKSCWGFAGGGGGGGGGGGATLFAFAAAAAAAFAAALAALRAVLSVPRSASNKSNACTIQVLQNSAIPKTIRVRIILNLMFQSVPNFIVRKKALSKSAKKPIKKAAHPETVCRFFRTSHPPIKQD